MHESSEVSWRTRQSAIASQTDMNRWRNYDLWLEICIIAISIRVVFIISSKCLDSQLFQRFYTFFVNLSHEHETNAQDRMIKTQQPITVNVTNERKIENNAILFLICVAIPIVMHSYDIDFFWREAAQKCVHETWETRRNPSNCWFNCALSFSDYFTFNFVYSSDLCSLVQRFLDARPSLHEIRCILKMRSSSNWYENYKWQKPCIHMHHFNEYTLI